MNIKVLTESERSTLCNGLRVAAERFKAHYQELFDAPPAPNPETHAIRLRLAKQFEKQYSDSIMLAQEIEDAERIEVIR